MFGVGFFFYLGGVCVCVFPLNNFFKYVGEQIPCPIISTCLNFCAGFLRLHCVT